MNLSAKKKALNLKRTYVGYCNLLILPLETPSNLHSLGDPWSIVPYASLRLRSKRPVKQTERTFKCNFHFGKELA